MSANVRSLARRIRLLPAVMAMAGCLLAVKGIDIVQDARAQTADAPTAARTSTDAKASNPSAPADKSAVAEAADQAGADSSDSAAEVDVLTSLARRRTELDARAKALDMRANLLAAAEKRVDAKIADLKSLQSQIQALLGKRDAAQKAQIASLVKVYASMKPRDAARIFNSLDEAVLLNVARAMKPDSLAAIMAAMNPQQAQDLTVKLASRLTLPNKPDLPAAANEAARPASSSTAGSAPAAAAGEAAATASGG